MKLIDLLVKELPKRGGWPEDAKYCHLTQYDSHCLTIVFPNKQIGTEDDPIISNIEVVFPGLGYLGDELYDCTVTAEQYEAALEASEGWVEWHGGECPVDSDSIVEVKYRKPNPYRYSNDRAGDFDWSHDDIDGDIIAYRLQQSTKSEQVRADAWVSYAGITEKDDESDLNECIGQDVDAPEWDGEGLPPVGTVCMANLANGWTDVKVAYIGDEGGCREALVFEIKSTKPAWADEFRPIRTEAERKREAAAKEMARHANSDPHRKFNAGLRNCLSIYDAIAAGKIPGVKLEEK